MLLYYNTFDILHLNYGHHHLKVVPSCDSISVICHIPQLWIGCNIHELFEILGV